MKALFRVFVLSAFTPLVALGAYHNLTLTNSGSATHNFYMKATFTGYSASTWNVTLAAGATSSQTLNQKNATGSWTVEEVRRDGPTGALLQFTVGPETGSGPFVQNVTADYGVLYVEPTPTPTPPPEGSVSVRVQWNFAEYFGSSEGGRQLSVAFGPIGEPFYIHHQELGPDLTGDSGAVHAFDKFLMGGGDAEFTTATDPAAVTIKNLLVDVATTPTDGTVAYAGGDVTLDFMVTAGLPDTEITTDIGLAGSEGGTASIFVDVDGDGIKEKVGEYHVDENGVGSFEIDDDWKGLDYEIRLTEVDKDGKTYDTDITLSSGSFGGEDTSVTGSLDIGSGHTTTTTTINSDGSTSNQNLDNLDYTLNGNSGHSYTYDDGNGGTVTTTYSGDNTTAATTGDIQTASAINSAENAGIIGALGGLGDKLDGIKGAIEDGNGEGEGEGAGDGDEIEDATPGDVVDAAAGSLGGVGDGSDETSGLQGAGQPSSSARLSGGDGDWSLQFGDWTIDLNPMTQFQFATYASWIRNLIVLVSTAVVVIAAYHFLFTFEAYTSLQPLGTTLGFKANIESAIAAAAASFGVAGVVLSVAAFAIFFGLAALAVTTVLASLITLPSLISAGLSWSEYGAPSVSTGFSLGGGNIMTTIWNYLQTAPSWLGRFLWLLDQWVPIAHLLVCIGNFLTINAWGTFLLRVLGTIKRFVPQ